MIRTIIGILVGIGILFLLLRRVDIRHLGEVVNNMNLSLLTLGLGIKVFVMWIKSFRWALILRKVTYKPVRHAFSANMIGFACNVILPARIGELARVSVIKKHNHISRSLALTTLGVTHLFDLLFLVLFFLLISILAIDLLNDYRMKISLIGVGVLLALAILWSLQKWFQHQFRSFILGIISKLPGNIDYYISRYSDMSVQGLRILSNGHALALVLLLTISVWGLETIAVYSILLAFHINASLLMAAVFVVVINLSFVFPITPGNVGIMQAVSIFILGIFGVSHLTALAYSIAYQGSLYIVIVSLGMFFLYRENMNLKLLGSPSDETGSPKEAPLTDKT